MNDRRKYDKFPPNPDYGSGCFRRRIRLSGSGGPSASGGKVIAELEDQCHGFRSTVYHNGETITDIQGEALRIPYNTCAGAVRPLRELIGIAVGADPKTINETVNPFSNCTHLFDMTVLAIRHAARGNSVRQYDVRVDDEVDGPADAVVSRDGVEVLRFKTRSGEVVEPRAFRGKPLYKGFAAWANATFEGEEREAAFVLQKGYFVATSRRFDMKNLDGLSGSDLPYIPGACHTYTPGIVEKAYRLDNSIRDFSDTPEQLLQFKNKNYF